MLDNLYYEWSDGFFTYYVNTVTGKKKFELEDNDILIDATLDDFCCIGKN